MSSFLKNLEDTVSKLWLRSTDEVKIYWYYVIHIANIVIASSESFYDIYLWLQMQLFTPFSVNCELLLVVLLLTVR